MISNSITVRLRQLLILAVMFICVSGFQCGFGSSSGGSSGGTGWKVWVKTSPCAGGRTDWISVAKENPGFGGGGSSWQTADLIISSLDCTKNDSCTFSAAEASAATVRASSRFLSYCCRDYSVWKNTQSGEMSVVKGMGSAGFGWQFEKGNLCCEEAAAEAGKPELCPTTPDGSNQAKAGYIGCYKDIQPFDLDGYLEAGSTTTPERCIATCRAKGFPYAGLQDGKSCLCGNSYGRYGTADNCNKNCTGDSSKICGGFSANSIYATGVSITGGRRPGGGGDNSDVKPYPTPTDFYEDGGRTPPPTQTPATGIGRWALVSVTAIPETPTGGYSYNAQSTSVHLDVYNGNTHDFQWTKPPAQFDANGFTVSLNTQCDPIPKNGCASLMGVRSDGLESDTPPGERKAEANGADGAPASGQKSVTFKPSLSSPNEIEVEVGLMWGAVRFIYKYRRI
jgi:hypothetical protein